MNDVRQLLHDHALVEPPDHLDLAAIMRAGARRRRRTTAVRLGAGSLAVATLATISATWPGRLDDPGPAGDGSRGAVLSLSEAELAVEGTDYRVLTTRRLHDSDDARIVGVSDDGLGVVVRQDGPDPDLLSVGLVDPADGGTTWLPGGPQTIEQQELVGADARRLVFRQSRWSDREPVFLVYDRAARTWSTVRWPGLPRAQAYYPVVHDDRVYLSLAREKRDPVMELWSVSLTDTADVRDEHAEVYRGYDITDDQLIWSDGSKGLSTRLHVRDLSSGQEHEVDPRLSAGCRVDTLDRIGDRLLLGQVCDDRDELLQVVTLTGERVVTVEGEGVGINLGGGGRVAVIAGGEGGPYVLDPASTELWRIGAPAALWDQPVPMPDGSGLTLWTTSDWVPSIDGDPDGEGPNEPTADDDVTDTQHLVDWIG